MEVIEPSSEFLKTIAPIELKGMPFVSYAYLKHYVSYLKNVQHHDSEVFTKEDIIRKSVTIYREINKSLTKERLIFLSQHIDNYDEPGNFFPVTGMYELFRVDEDKYSNELRNMIELSLTPNGQKLLTKLEMVKIGANNQQDIENPLIKSTMSVRGDVSNSILNLYLSADEVLQQLILNLLNAWIELEKNPNDESHQEFQKCMNEISLIIAEEKTQDRNAKLVAWSYIAAGIIAVAISAVWIAITLTSPPSLFLIGAALLASFSVASASCFFVSGLWRLETIKERPKSNSELLSVLLRQAGLFKSEVKIPEQPGNAASGENLLGN